MYSAMIFSVVSSRLRLTRSVREAMAAGGCGVGKEEEEGGGDVGMRRRDRPGGGAPI